MPRCPICGAELERIYICRAALAGECEEDDECPGRSCYEPVEIGWECPECGVEYG